MSADIGERYQGHRGPTVYLLLIIKEEGSLMNNCNRGDKDNM